jgi:type IV secretion system protein VirD4
VALSKTKLKIGLFIALSVIGLTVGFLFCGYLNLLLSGGNIDDLSALRPAAILASLAANEHHRMLTLCVELVIVAGIAALMLMSRKDTFESDTASVTDAIKTPIAIGQGQHGTARWLRKTERTAAFSLVRLTDEDEIFTALLDAGARDRGEVRAYKTESEKVAENPNAADNQAVTDPETKQAQQ